MSWSRDAFTEAVCDLGRFIAVFLIITVPLALWKLVDIAVWVFSHISIGWR